MRNDKGGRSPGPYRVLLVEDALDQAHLMQFLLENEAESRVTVIQDGLKGCRFARDRNWDLVIVDINLPGADGLQVMRASKESHPHTPVLATTAYTNPEYANQALRSGADDFLQKPIEREDLLEKIAVLLGREDPAEKLERDVQEDDARAQKEEEARVELDRSGAGGAPGVAAGTRGGDTSVDPWEWNHKQPEARPGHVLAIGARPGDVESGCGGTLLAHRARGDSVAILTLIGKDGAPEERKAEAKRAGRRIGATLVSGHIVPAAEGVESEMAKLVESVVRQFRPEIVYTHTPHDSDAEHRTAHLATLTGSKGVPNVYGYQTEKSTVDFHPSVFVDVSERLDGKLELLSEYHFTEDEPQQGDSALVDVTARYWGRFSGHARAEPLEVLRGPEPSGAPHRHPLVPEGGGS